MNEKIETPFYLIDEQRLKKNAEILKSVREKFHVKILLAQKAFSTFYFYPLLKNYLDGTVASGLFEARLGYEYFGKEVHVFSPAYPEKDFEEILNYANHIVFNSLHQLKKFCDKAKAKNISIGLRINPEHSTQDKAIYDPCAKNSRLGVRLCDLQNADETLLKKIDGLHFHTLCEQNAEPLAETADIFFEKFEKILKKLNLKWINFGGGHHITKKNYHQEILGDVICKTRKILGNDIEIYLEPGEAIALDAGELVASVLDIVQTDGLPVAILDTSAACHMPDVLEMPYQPRITGAKFSGDGVTYRLSSMTCLAGDVIGDYVFEKPLKIGDQIYFEDMAIYTMVKNNMFNGMNLPSIVARKENGTLHLIKKFGYEDFKNRLS